MLEPKIDILVSSEWLAANINEPDLVIIEIGTTEEDFEEGHIPGAVRCPSPQLKGEGDADRRLIAPPEQFATILGNMGVSDSSIVVGYDRVRNRDASRLWWALNYYGHSRVSVLNGGWKKWVSENRAQEHGSGLRPIPKAFHPLINDLIQSDVTKLTMAIDDPDALIWDIRAIDEFTGENSRGNQRVGHVPGALHLEWVDLVDEKDHTFLAADAMQEKLNSAGITKDKSVHIY